MPTRAGIDFDFDFDFDPDIDRTDRQPLPEGAGLFGRDRGPIANDCQGWGVVGRVVG
ncbi:MAG: hypothetical protein PHF14_10395 [Verrucomicrobiota bacterium]|nr:hypothetical protein [Verrucomicrobiota bacterium]